MGNNLEGKVAVVAGSGQGIGRAIAIHLAKEGAKIVANNRCKGSTGFAFITEENLKALSDEDKKWLQSYSQVHGISLSEAVRQGVRRLKVAEQQEVYRVLVKKTRGVWKKGDGLKYQKNVRSEWHET